MEATLNHFLTFFPSFETLSHPEKFKLFGYFLTHLQSNNVFNATNILGIYSELDIRCPKNPSDILAKLHASKQIHKSDGGYRLDRKEVKKIEESLKSPMVISVAKSLLNLPEKISDSKEKEFLCEAINCYSVSAFRAAVIMTWNLTMYHLMSYILTHKLPAFNAALSKDPIHKKVRAIVTIDDFSDMREVKFIELCRTARVISGDVKKILDKELDFRNSCAHPSNIVIGEEKAVVAICDLVENVIIKYPI